MEAPPRSSRAAASAQGLYERHSAKILGYCLHQLGSREEAEDAVQTTFMNAFRALERGVVPESESAWLFKIAANVCLSRRRSSWRRGRVESPSDFDVIEEIVPGPTRHRDELIGIEDALASMPDQQRRAILLREWQGLSYREIADELEVSQSAVETLIFRARRSLAQGLEQPERAKQPKRRAFRRALHAADAGAFLAAAKTLVAGSAAAQATAAAVAVTAVAGSAAAVKNEGHSPLPAESTPALVVEAAPKPAAATEATSASGAAVPARAERAAQPRPTVPTPPRTTFRARVAQAKAVQPPKPVTPAPASAAGPAPAPVEEAPVPAAPHVPAPAPIAAHEPTQPPARSERRAAPAVPVPRSKPRHQPSNLVVVAPRPTPEVPAHAPAVEGPARDAAEPEAAQDRGRRGEDHGRRP